MPKVKEITVNVSKKIGMKNFSSDMVSASATVSVENDDYKAAYNKAWEVCWGEIEGQMRKYESPVVANVEVKSYAPNPDAGVEPDWIKEGKI